MSPTLSIVLLWAAFTATHLGLASARVEPKLRAKLGNLAASSVSTPPSRSGCSSR